ncbi:MAG: PRC-barrel domain-containing protein [Desulfobacterales bacterium]
MKGYFKSTLVVLASLLIVMAYAIGPAIGADTTYKGTSATKGTLSTTDQQHQATGMQSSGSSDHTSAGVSNETFRASQIIGKTVKGDQNKDLGEVEDVVMSQDGRAQYLVVSFGGILGMDDKLVPIPFDTSRFTFQEDAIVISGLDEQKLKNAPNLGDKQWQSLQEPGFEQDVRGYYGAHGQNQSMGGQDGSVTLTPNQKQNNKYLKKDGMMKNNNSKKQD